MAGNSTCLRRAVARARRLGPIVRHGKARAGGRCCGAGGRGGANYPAIALCAGTVLHARGPCGSATWAQFRRQRSLATRPRRRNAAAHTRLDHRRSRCRSTIEVACGLPPTSPPAQFCDRDPYSAKVRKPVATLRQLSSRPPGGTPRTARAHLRGSDARAKHARERAALPSTPYRFSPQAPASPRRRR